MEERDKEAYLKWITGYFGKLFDSHFFGTIENLKLQDGMACHIDREIKSEPIPKFIRKGS